MLLSNRTLLGTAVRTPGIQFLLMYFKKTRKQYDYKLPTLPCATAGFLNHQHVGFLLLLLQGVKPTLLWEQVASTNGHLEVLKA